MRWFRAKKLFFFDLTLLGFIVILIGATIFWFLYNPQVVLDEIRHIQKIAQEPAAAADDLSGAVAAEANIFFYASIGTTQAVRPGDIVPLRVTVRNLHTETLEDVTVVIPMPPLVIDAPRLYASSRGANQDGSLLFTSKERDGLARILPGEEFTIDVAVPIADVPSSGDTDLTLAFTPRVRGMIGAQAFEARAKTDAVAVGTALTARTQLRYYTEDGDQIGRGPLPPTVGYETRYGMLITIGNSTSRVENLTVSGRLTPSSAWTGKTSVNQGRPMTYDAETRTFYWQLSELEPHDTVQLFAEIGFTPGPEDTGQTQTLVQDFWVRGRDSYVGASIAHAPPSLDSSLSTDARAKLRGVRVQ